MTPQKWCEMGCKLLLTNNEKLHTGFQLVPKSITLNAVNGKMVIILHYLIICSGFGSQLCQNGL